MNFKEVKDMMEAIEGFCSGEKTALDVSQAINESYDSIIKLLTMTGVADTLGNVSPGIEPWRVVATINMIYFLRCDKGLRGTVVALQKKLRKKTE